MALQTFDFLNARGNVASHSGIGNALSKYLEGYEARYKPAQLEADQKKRDLANALAEIQTRYEEPRLKGQIQHQNLVNKYYGPEREAHIKQMLAAAQRSNDPRSRLTGIAAEYQSIMDLESRYGKDNPYIVQLKRELESRIAGRETLGQVRNQNIQFKPWSPLTKEDQAQITGQYRALGIGASDALELYTNKVTPELIAGYQQANPGSNIFDAVKGVVNQLKQAGAYSDLEPSNIANQNLEAGTNEIEPMQAGMDTVPQQQERILPVDPRTLPIQPAMTTQNITKFNELNANTKAADFLGKTVADWNAWGAQQFMGYSPKEIYTALRGRKDPQETLNRRKWLAAQMLGPDLALLSIRINDGSSAQEAIKDIESRLKLRANTLGLTVTPEDYRVATDLLLDVLKEDAKIRKDALAGIERPENDFKSALETSNNATVKRVYQGKTYYIPKELVEEFDKEHQ